MPKSCDTKKRNIYRHILLKPAMAMSAKNISALWTALDVAAPNLI